MIICLMHRESDKMFSISLIQTWLIISANLNIQQKLKMLIFRALTLSKNIVIHLFTPHAPISDSSPQTKATTKVDRFTTVFCYVNKTSILSALII